MLITELFQQHLCYGPIDWIRPLGATTNRNVRHNRCNMPIDSWREMYRGGWGERGRNRWREIDKEREIVIERESE